MAQNQSPITEHDRQVIIQRLEQIRVTLQSARMHVERRNFPRADKYMEKTRDMLDELIAERAGTKDKGLITHEAEPLP